MKVKFSLNITQQFLKTLPQDMGDKPRPQKKLGEKNFNVGLARLGLALVNFCLQAYSTTLVNATNLS